MRCAEVGHAEELRAEVGRAEVGSAEVERAEMGRAEVLLNHDGSVARPAQEN